MKIVFKDIGLKKLSKVVEISTLFDYKTLPEFCALEIKSYMPEKGKYEFVPTDGLPELLSNAYAVVYTDVRYMTYGMGTVVVYH